jgi:hypothetical protein
MTKYISFSLFGNSPKYLTGLEKNIQLAKKYYPDWKVIVYCDEVKDIMSQYDNIDAIFCIIPTNAVATMWRFFVHDRRDCERFIIRDADSRISEREALAVNEWIKSGKTLHLMRDHPHHGHKIMGGMWGMIPQKDFDMQQECESYISRHNNTTKWSMTDMDFLRDIVYPKFGHDSKVHATYAKFEPWAEDFPTTLVDKRFVGEIWQADDSRDYQRDLI